MKRGLIRWREGGWLLGLVRSLALILALALFFFFSETRPFIFEGYLLISIVTFYTVMRIIFPFYRYGKHPNYTIYTLAIIDVTICCFLPFVSGGLHSPFIIYPLTAILSFSLFFSRKYAYVVSGIAAIMVIGSEVFTREILGAGTIFPVQIYIALMAIYIIIAFLIAWLPYTANINLSTTIKQRAIIEERSRLSRELHDGLAQRLSSLILRIDLLRDSVGSAKTFDALADIANLRRELQNAYSEVREVIDQLRIKMEESPGIGMISILAQYTQEFAQHTGINCQLYLSDGHIELQPLATVELLRVVQETLSNIKKHSDASLIEVRFETKPDVIMMLIKDDGRGFNQDDISSGHGLAVMKERTEGLGGEFVISSTPGRGTEIRVTLPVRDDLMRSRID